MGYIGAGPTRFNTADSLNINGDGATVTGIKDEDNMASNSAVKLATQQSIKAYVDSQIGANNELSEVLANGNTTGGNDISFADNDKAIFGAGSDLQIYHDGSNSYFTESGTGRIYITTNGPSVILGQTNGENMLIAYANGSVDLYYDNTVKLATTSGGIDVTGTVTADSGTHTFGDGTGTSQMVLLAGTTGNSTLDFGDSADANIGRIQYEHTNDALTFRTNNIERMRLDASGNVNIYGTDNRPLAITSFNTVSAGAGWDLDATSGNGVVSISTGGTERMRVDSSGNVGIGTSPTQKLHVDATGSTTAALFDNNGTNGDVVRVAKNGTDILKIRAEGTADLALDASGGSFIFKEGGTEAMRLDSSGRLGLGTSVPTELLHIREDGADASILVRTQGATAGTYHAAKLQFELGATASATRDWDIVADDPSNNGGYLGVEYEGSEKFRITAGGNVGIGTASANKSSSSTALTVNTSTATNYSALELSSGDTLNWHINANNGNVYDVTAGTRNRIFYTNGSERMRVDSSGNVAIGDSVAEAKLHVKSAGTAGLDVSQGVKIEGYGAGGNGDAACLAFAAGDAQVKGAITFTRNNSYGRGYMSFLVNNDASYANPSTSDEKMRIDGSGNVGIGTTPLAKFHVDNTNSAFYMGYGGNEDIYLQTTNGNVLFTNKGATTERMRINSAGHLLLNTTSHNFSTTQPFQEIYTPGASNGGLSIKSNQSSSQQYHALGLWTGANGSTSTGYAVSFYHGSGGVNEGTISVTSAGVTYNTTSDYRLKENIEIIADAKERLLALKPVRHSWKDAPETTVDGFIAHEVQEAGFEYAVTGEKDAEDMQSMDYGRITPVIVAALQDALKEIDMLKDRIAELEAK